MAYIIQERKLNFRAQSNLKSVSMYTKNYNAKHTTVTHTHTFTFGPYTHTHTHTYLQNIHLTLYLPTSL